MILLNFRNLEIYINITREVEEKAIIGSDHFYIIDLITVILI